MAHQNFQSGSRFKSSCRSCEIERTKWSANSIQAIPASASHRDDARLVQPFMERQHELEAKREANGDSDSSEMGSDEISEDEAESKPATTKECLTVTVAFGISGVQVTRILDSIALFRGYPATIRTDQGPEFTCRALDQWAFEHGVELRLIQPGKPTQNEFVESFNGRFRDECLN